MDFEAILSERGKRLAPSAIRALLPLASIPGMITLAGGNPNPSCFPFTAMNLRTRDGTELSVDGAELSAALQYSPSRGNPGLVAWLADHVRKTHAPPSPVEVVVGSGSQDLLGCVFDIFLGADSTLLCEEFTYPGAMAAMRPTGCRRQGVAMDADGIVPEALHSVLASWSVSARGPRPRLLYLIPSGQNPTGSTMTVERKKRVYEIAREFDLVILEDDPYYNLVYGEPAPSFLSMDTDGRVIRFDSFSKVLSAGIRLGFMTAPAFVAAKVEQHMQMSILHANSFSQIAVLALLRAWGDEGWARHVREVKAFYAARAKEFTAILHEHLDGLATWDEPRAGMFCWIKLLGVDNTKELIQVKARERKVLALPGETCCANERPVPFIRLAFSIASHDDMVEGVKRLASLLK